MKNFFFLLALFALASCTSLTSDTSDLPTPSTTNAPEVEMNPALQPVEKEAPEASVLRADFTIDNSNGEVNENAPLQLTNLSENAVSWEWDFGNGKTSTEETPVHTYPIHGPYTVTLKVTDEEGNVETASREVTVLCIFGGGSHDE